MLYVIAERSDRGMQRSWASAATALVPPLVLAATLKELISQTMIRWAQEDQIQDAELVRMMFNLLRRQYDSIGELLQALRKTYTISQASVSDTISLLAALGQIRCLLSVRMGKEEELLMINGLGWVIPIRGKLAEEAVLKSSHIKTSGFPWFHSSWDYMLIKSVPFNNLRDQTVGYLGWRAVARRSRKESWKKADI